MARIRVYNLGSLNLKVSPFLHEAGEMIRMVNMEKDMVGALKKRPGFIPYLTDINGTVTNLWDWRDNSGTQFWTYAVSGGSIYSSTQGTGDWTITGNGTMTDGAGVGHGILENTMIVGDGTAATRHTTSGTNFTNTTAAPKARYFQDYQNRIYAGGTANALFFSNVGTPTDWTNDSSSLNIPGAGRINSVFKSNDRLVVSQNSGIMHRWDGFNLVDMATDLGPSSDDSIGKVEDFRFYLNRRGVFGYGGNKPEIVSNAIERQIYNDKGEGIVGGTFDVAPGVAHRFDYYVAVGAVTDNLTDETLDRAVLKYDFQLDEWSNYQFSVLPTAFMSFRDNNNDEQLVFGDNTGLTYQFGGTALSDNGAAITAVAEGVLHFGAPDIDKKFNQIQAFANPGCQAKVTVAVTSSFTKGKKNWMPLGDFHDGVAELRFPNASQGKLLHWKIVESSKSNRFHFYGFSVDIDMEPEKR